MLRKVTAAMMTNDRALVDEVSKMDNSVDILDEAIKLYVTKLTRGSLGEREGQRARASLTSPDMKTPNAIRSESIVRACQPKHIRDRAIAGAALAQLLHEFFRSLVANARRNSREQGHVAT